MNDQASPIVVEVTRGDMVESRHHAAVAVVDIAGTVVLRAGDIEGAVYARSAIKPLQALALVESGAVDAFGLTEPEIVLACASHSGNTRQRNLAVATVIRAHQHLTALGIAGYDWQFTGDINGRKRRVDTGV